MRIHLSYSDRHFSPDRDPVADHRSVTQIARHLWEVLGGFGGTCSYGELLPDEPLDLLVTQSPRLPRRRPGRMVYVQAGAHPLVTELRIRNAHRAARHAFPGVQVTRREWRSRPEIWREHAMVMRADRTLLIGDRTTHASYAGLLPCDAGRVSPLSYGIDSCVFSSPGTRAERAAFVYPATRFCLRKGAHVVAQAWTAFVGRHPGAHLILLGRPGDFDVRGALDGVAGVEIAGEYTAGSAQHLAWLGRADWVVFPSLAEGQAGSLMEAMACGCLPLATRESGFDPEAFGGWAVAPGDPSSLQLALEAAVAADPAPRRVRCVDRIGREHGWEGFRQTAHRAIGEVLAQQASGHAPRVSDWLAFLKAERLGCVR